MSLARLWHHGPHSLLCTKCTDSCTLPFLDVTTSRSRPAGKNRHRAPTPASHGRRRPGSTAARRPQPSPTHNHTATPVPLRLLPRHPASSCQPRGGPHAAPRGRAGAPPLLPRAAIAQRERCCNVWVMLRINALGEFMTYRVYLRTRRRWCSLGSRGAARARWRRRSKTSTVSATSALATSCGRSSGLGRCWASGWSGASSEGRWFLR